jgi:BlaI family transcriptional regulator, penicillinase repressor
MEKPSASVADAELKLLQVLWERGRSTARELTELTYGRESTDELAPSQIATVQKLLTRLESKKLVERDRSQHVHTFAATISRDSFAGNQLEQMADKLTEGSLIPFLTHLIEARKLSRQERQQIRQLLEDESPKKRSRESK